MFDLGMDFSRVWRERPPKYLFCAYYTTFIKKKKDVKAIEKMRRSSSTMKGKTNSHGSHANPIASVGGDRPSLQHVKQDVEQVLRSASPTTRERLRHTLSDYASILSARIASMEQFAARESDLRTRCGLSSKRAALDDAEYPALHVATAVDTPRHATRTPQRAVENSARYKEKSTVLSMRSPATINRQPKQRGGLAGPSASHKVVESRFHDPCSHAEVVVRGLGDGEETHPLPSSLVSSSVSRSAPSLHPPSPLEVHATFANPPSPRPEQQLTPRVAAAAYTAEEDAVREVFGAAERNLKQAFKDLRLKAQSHSPQHRTAGDKNGERTRAKAPPTAALASSASLRDAYESALKRNRELREEVAKVIQHAFDHAMDDEPVSLIPLELCLGQQQVGCACQSCSLYTNDSVTSAMQDLYAALSASVTQASDSATTASSALRQQFGKAMLEGIVTKLRRVELLADRIHLRRLQLLLRTCNAALGGFDPIAATTDTNPEPASLCETSSMLEALEAVHSAAKAHGRLARLDLLVRRKATSLDATGSMLSSLSMLSELLWLVEIQPK